MAARGAGAGTACTTHRGHASARLARDWHLTLYQLHQDGRVLLDCLEDLRLRSLKILHEHLSKVLVGQQALADGRETWIVDQSLQLLLHSRIKTAGCSAASHRSHCVGHGCTIVALLAIGLFSSHVRISLGEAAAHEDLEGEIRLVMGSCKSPHAVLA